MIGGGADGHQRRAGSHLPGMTVLGQSDTGRRGQQSGIERAVARVTSGVVAGSAKCGRNAAHQT